MTETVGRKRTGRTTAATRCGPSAVVVATTLLVPLAVFVARPTQLHAQSAPLLASSAASSAASAAQSAQAAASVAQSAAASVASAVSAAHSVAASANVAAAAVASAAAAVSAAASVVSSATPEAVEKKADEKADVRQNLKYIRYGISVGVAYAFHLSMWPIHKASSAALDAPAATSMPYLLLLPAYWTYTAPKAAYCAANYSASEETAVKAGMELEKSSQQKWTDGTGCWGSKFGAFLGFPSKHDATTTLEESNGSTLQKVRPFKSVFSFGATFTPNAYVSVLLGMTVANIDRDNGVSVFVPAWLFGVGGNLDIITTALKAFTGP